MRRFLAVLIAGVAGCVIAQPAQAQCSYPLLTDDVPQAFSSTSTPTYARFVQSAGRWAGAAVRSSGTANWDVGFSTGTAAFPTCLTVPVVASQQSSGIDFVIGDFAAQGTGTRYAPIAKPSGTGSGTLEWDSGSRTAVIGTGVNFGNGGTNLIDVWNVSLVAGKSYSVFLSGPAGEFILYAFQRAGANTWRQKSDAVLVVGSQYSGPWVFTPTVTGTYPLVVVNDANSPSFYGFTIEECADPPDLTTLNEQNVPVQPGHHFAHYEVTPTAPGFPTIAVRPTEGYNTSIGVAPRSAPGAWPTCDYLAVNSTNANEAVELVVGDFASGVLSLGNHYWIGLSGPQAIGTDTWIEYDPGDWFQGVNGGSFWSNFAEHDVVRAARTDLTAGQDVIIHVASCDDAVLKLWIFRPFDTNVPFGGGWSSPDNHPPLVAEEIYNVQDFTFTPPVTGPYAIVITKQDGYAGCVDFAISTCKPRLLLHHGNAALVTADPSLAFAGQPLAVRHDPNEPWSAIAVRPFAANENWDIEVVDDVAGASNHAPPPLACLGNPIATTLAPGSLPVDFLVRRAPFPLQETRDRITTARVFPVANATAGGGARVEYEIGYQNLVVGAPPTKWVVNPGEVIGMWNVDLTANQNYTLWLDPRQTGVEVYVYGDWNPCANCPPEWTVPEGAGMLYHTNQTGSFSASTSGRYAVVAVNPNAASDTVGIAFYAGAVGVAPSPTAELELPAPRFDSVAPNPATAGSTLQFSFALPRPARVAFEVVDLAGRLVARMQDADTPAGTNRRAWTLASKDGRSLAPGVYFARMWVDGAPVAKRKLSITR